MILFLIPGESNINLVLWCFVALCNRIVRYVKSFIYPVTNKDKDITGNIKPDYFQRLRYDPINDEDYKQISKIQMWQVYIRIIVTNEIFVNWKTY